MKCIIFVKYSITFIYLFSKKRLLEPTFVFRSPGIIKESLNYFTYFANKGF